jgi:uncharacterized delta-60 repeat protein
VLAGWFAVAACLALGTRPASAQLTGNGDIGFPETRAVVNFSALAELQKSYGSGVTTTNRRSIHPPLPRRELTNSAVPNPFGGGNGGGGGGAAPAPDANPFQAAALPLPSPSPTIDFNAIDDNQTVIPPDTHGAVGPNHVMTVLNSQVRIQNRTGGTISTVDLNTFWQTTGALDCFDPKTLYDPYANRWIFTAMADGQTTRSAVLMGVSQTSDPTAGWNLFRVPADRNRLSWADYPSLGFNKDWIVVSANMFPIFFGTGVGFDGVNIYVFNKTNLYANGTGQFTMLRDGSTIGFTMVPAITYDNTISTMHLVEVDDLFHGFSSTTRRLRLSTITGPIGREVLTLGSAFTVATNEWGSSEPVIQTFLFGGFAPQLGSFEKISTSDARIQNVVYRNGWLWTTHHIFLPANNPTHTAVQWWQVATNGSMLQFGRIEDPSGTTFYAYPTIMVNRNDDALLGFSKFSPFQYASGNYAYRACTDPLNTFRMETTLKAGEGPYEKLFFFGGFENRWGDYSSTVVDPINDLDFWTIQSYAAAPTNFFGILVGAWGTWWGKVLPVESCQKIEFQYGLYSVNEASPGFATITVLNIGGAPGTVDFATSDGTAIAGQDYLARSGTITFAAGQTETNFIVVVLDNAVVNSNKTVELTLFNPTGVAVLGRTAQATLVIEDDETQAFLSVAGEFNFSTYLNGGTFFLASEYETFIYPCGNAAYTVINAPDRSAPGVLVTVTRTGGSTGRVLVDYETSEGGSAIPFVDYTPVDGTLVFDDHQMSTNFLVEVFPEFFLTTLTNLASSRFIRVVLSNPRPAPEEEAENPGAIRPTLGLGKESGISVHGIGGLTNGVMFERQQWIFDEYNSPTQVGGYRVFNVQILNPGAQAGRVRFRTRQFPDGGGWGEFIFPTNYLMARSDFAEAPASGGLAGFEVWPNPIYTDPALTTVTNWSDYLATNVIIEFAQNECRRNFLMVITNDPTVEFNEDILCILTPVPGGLPVNPLGAIANVTITFNSQPAGAVDREWNVYNLASSDPPFNRLPGADGIVRSLAVQPDGKTVLGGDFIHVNSYRFPGIARMLPNGSVDQAFEVGEGVNGFITTVLLYPTNSPNVGKILVAGSFSSFNGRTRRGIARLFPNGQLDTSFDPGNGPNNVIWSMALQSDDKVVVGGAFSEFNEFQRIGVARLNTDGSIDSNFDPQAGVGGTVSAVGVWPVPGDADRIVLGGDFVTYNTVFTPGIVRLNPDGSVDPNFETGGGVNGPVLTLAVQPDGKVIVGGSFSEINARSRINLARFNADGSLDLSYNPGFGTDGPIYGMTVQPDGKALIGGPFTQFNGTRRMGFARLRLNGTLDTSFLDTGYNQFAGLIKALSFEPPNFAMALAVQPDGNIMVGGSFTNLGGNPSFRAPLRNDWTVFTRADKQIRQNIARVIGGATPGPGNAEYESPEYFVAENADLASIQLQRTDGRLGSLLAFAEAFDRVAITNLDYTVTNRVNLWREGVLSPPRVDNAPIHVGQVSPAYFRIPILNDNLREGDETVGLNFVRPGGSIILGGEYIPLGGALGRAEAVLNIADDDQDYGVINFAFSVYATNENAGTNIITLIRTNGAYGSVGVTLLTRTSPITPIATPGPTNDYSPVFVPVTFAHGETSKTVRIPIHDDGEVEFDENVQLVLTNATGGAKLTGGTPTSITTALMTIIDNDYPPGRLNFAATTFVTNENAVLATIAVTRLGGSFGDVTVSYATSDGTATSPADYTATTGTLNWRNLESGTRTFTIPLALDGIVDSSRFESVFLRLFNPRSGTLPDSKLLGIRTNAVLQIEDSDAYGTLAFSQPFYQADENGGVTTITVVRHDGSSGTVSANYSITPADPLSPGRDYVPTGGTLTFGPGESSKSFNITLLDDTESDGNKALILTLAGPVNATIGTPNPVTLTLIDNESFNVRAGELDTAFRADTQTDGPIYALGLQADGRIVVAGEFAQVDNVTRTRVARLRTDGALDATFDPVAGPNGSVRTLVIQPDNKILLGGFFTQYNGTNRGSITRINSDGTLDSQFLPGSGANNPVYALALQPDNKVLVGGSFSTFDSMVPSRPGIVRLLTNGIVDLSFNTGGGPDNAVYAVALQTDGKILLGGEFLAVDGQPRTRLARLNRNGSLDNSFVTQTINGAVRTLLVQTDGKIVAGGSFTGVGASVRNYLARFNSDGSLDTSFLAAPLLGGDGVVLTMMQQVDGRLLVAGDFRTFNGVTRNRLTRLNTDGTTDPTINFGTGANSFVSALAVQPDREILLGGGFTRIDDQPRLHIARIHGGAIAGPGAIEFSRAEFLAQENGTNALITMRRRFGTTGAISVQYQTLDGTAVAGLHYQTTTGTASFAEGETQYSFLVPILDNSVVNADLFFGLQLDGNTFTGGATNGPQPIAQVFILDDEGSISFASSTFSAGEDTPSGLASIVVARHGGTNTTATVRFATANGTATAGSDYFPTNGTLTFFPGETAKLFHVRLINDTNVELNETVQLTLSNPSGSNVLGIASATLLIVENDFSSGRFIWSSSTYTSAEGDTNVVVTVLRTNGSSGVVTVRVHTLENTAVGGSDYLPYDNVLTFAEGDIAKSVNIPIVDDLLVEADETFDVRLSDPTGGATLGSLTNAQVFILNDDNSFIRPAEVTLISESLTNNGIIDPNETVTMGLALRNVGTGDTIDLVGTLLSGNGVTPLSGPQHYGVLQANGPSVSRPFTFLASGAAGDRIVATLLLTDTGSTNGSAPFPFTIGGQASRTFSSTNRITIVDNSPASPYPSAINVSSMGGTITKVSVTLSNLSHNYPLDLDIMLVGPSNEKVVLMSDAGGTTASPNPLSNVTLTFDMAGAVLPATTRINSGTYRPANYAGQGTADAFPPPAPPMPYTNIDLSVFNGANPNGNWSLYVVDDTSVANGTILGWSLSIQTSDPVSPSPSFAQADVSIRTASATGPVLLGANVANSISVSNSGPGEASTVGVISQIPSGLQLLNAASTSGTWKLVNRTLTWKIPSLPSGSSATLSLNSLASAVGMQVNPLTAAANELDPNLANNSASLVTTVISMPELQVTRTSNSVRLTWVGDASFALQVTDRWAGNWSDVPDAPTVNGSERTVVQGVAPGSPARFYRLRTR